MYASQYTAVVRTGAHHKLIVNQKGQMEKKDVISLLSGFRMGSSGAVYKLFLFELYAEPGITNENTVLNDELKEKLFRVLSDGGGQPASTFPQLHEFIVVVGDESTCVAGVPFGEWPLITRESARCALKLSMQAIRGKWAAVYQLDHKVY